MTNIHAHTDTPTAVNAVTDPTALLDGCADPEVARTRAHQVIGGYASAADEAEGYWNAHAERVFAALLHAAALDSDRTVDDVSEWLITPDSLSAQITAALVHVEDQAMRLDAEQFMTTHRRIRTSLCTTILTAQARAVVAQHTVGGDDR